MDFYTVLQEKLALNYCVILSVVEGTYAYRIFKFLISIPISGKGALFYFHF